MSRVIFLDRDGTLNVDIGYVNQPEQWQWQPGAIDALQLFSEKGYQLVVVTNQSGIGTGRYTLVDVTRTHEAMQRDLKNAGIRLAAVALCPHARDAECRCRKPNVGMLDTIASEIDDISFSESWTIGDKPSDIGFGKNAGTKTALLRSAYWQETDELPFEPDLVCDSLYQAAQRIIATS